VRRFNRSGPDADRIKSEGNKQRKVLMISRAFPPENTSPVQRPMKFAKYLPKYGWTPFVVTTKKNIEPLDYDLIRDLPKEVSVDEVFSLDPANLGEILKKKYESGNIGEITYQILRVILKAYSMIYYRIVIVDWYDGWVPFGLMKGRHVVKNEDIDLVFVDMEPPSSSMIGILLKMLIRKPLVIDYHDPWTTSVYAKRTSRLRKRIAECLEHKILRLADGITAGKPLIISEIMEKFRDIDKRKFLTILSGYDRDDFSGLEKRNESKFVVTYTGKISEKFYYSPESFLHALGELVGEKKIPEDEVSAVFVGTVSSQYKNRFRRLVKDLGLEKVVINTGSVDHKKCAEYQLNSNVLLYIMEALEGKEISYQFSGALPSKIYEYIYSGNTIMAIVPPGFEADLIEKTRTGYVAEPNNVSAVKKLLYYLYKRYKEGTLKIDPDQAEVNKYDRKILTGKLAGLFDGIILGDT